MPSTNIPDDDTLARYVKPSHVIRDPDTNVVLGVFNDAFKLKPGEAELSTGWLEYYSAPKANRLAQTRAAYAAAMTVKPSAVFALGNVGNIKAACAKFNQQVRILHEPDLPHLPAHAAMRRYTDTDDELLQLLADEAWNEFVPAK